MSVQLNPYLSFTTNARDAMAFYQSVLGGELDISTFGDFGQSDTPLADLIMHANLATPSGFTLMAADSPPQWDHIVGTNVSISLSGTDTEELRGYFAGLCEGGTILTPLAVQMWGDEFGMLTDKFGIHWLVNITVEKA